MKIPSIVNEEVFVSRLSVAKVVRVLRYRTWSDGTFSTAFMDTSGVWVPYENGLELAPKSSMIPLVV